MIIYSFLIGALMGVLNSYSKKIDSSMVVSFFSVIFLTIVMSADFITSLLTHGLIFAILLLTVIGGGKPGMKK